MTNKKDIRDYASLVDSALLRAESLKIVLVNHGAGQGAISGCNNTIENLKKLKQMILIDTLPRVSKGQIAVGAGLGLTRAAGEWTEDDELFDLLLKIEQIFGHSW